MFDKWYHSKDGLRINLLYRVPFGIANIVQGLVIVLTLGYYSPQISYKYAVRLARANAN